MRSFRLLLRFLFMPNPGGASYMEREILFLLAVSALLVIGSFLIRLWRRSLQNPLTRKLSRSWSSAAFWFGIVGGVLVVGRVERIQFLAMRFLWIPWALAIILYVIFHIRQFRTRHYNMLPRQVVEDPREKYLPGRKKK